MDLMEGSSVTDVALTYGFETVSGFNNGFEFEKEKNPIK